MIRRGRRIERDSFDLSQRIAALVYQLWQHRGRDDSAFSLRRTFRHVAEILGASEDRVRRDWRDWGWRSRRPTVAPTIAMTLQVWFVNDLARYEAEITYLRARLAEIRHGRGK